MLNILSKADKWLWFSLAAISVFNFFTSSDLLVTIAVAIAIIYLLSCNQKKVLPFFIFISFYLYLFLNGENDLHRYIYLSFIIRSIFICGGKTLPKLLFISFIYIGFHIYSSIGVIPISIGLFTPFFSILCLYLACCIYEEKDRELCIYSYLYGYFSSIILGLLRPYCRLEEILSIDFVEDITTLRFAALSFDPNYFTILSVITLFILLFNYGTNFKNKILWLALVGITIAAAAMTFSKSFYISLAMFLLLTLLKAPKQIKKNLLYSVPILFILVIVFREHIENAIGIMETRFGNVDDVNGLTTGRDVIWELYLDEMIRYPDKAMLGFGFLDLERAAHNTYIEIIFKFGIVGLLTNILYIGYCVVRTKGNIALNILNCFFVLLFLSLLSMLNFYTFYQISICFFVIIVMIKDQKRQCTTDICY